MQALTRTLAILDAVSTARSPLSLSDIAERTSLPVPTCHRIVQSMVDEDVLIRDEGSRRYSMGGRLARLVGMPDQLEVSAATRDIQRLRDRWGVCFYLTKLTASEVVCMLSVAAVSAGGMGMFVPLGARLPIHASASSRAILAECDLVVQESQLAAAPRERFTEATRTELSELLEELRRTRERGFAICDGEIEAGSFAMAVAIPDPFGSPAWSLGSVGLSDYMTAATEKGLVADMEAVAKELRGIWA